MTYSPKTGPYRIEVLRWREQKTDVVFEPKEYLEKLAFLVLCENSADRLRGPPVVVQDPSQSFLALDIATQVGWAAQVVDQLDADPMVISPAKILMPRRSALKTNAPFT